MPDPAYLAPYINAARQHGGGFRSLLWASPQTQALRFDALHRLCTFRDRVILDAGCGRADFLDYLLNLGIRPTRYIGVEAVADLADVAEHKRHPNTRIIRGDFIHKPILLRHHADVTIFCGSLNTLSPKEFYQSLKNAWQFTRELAFNFLCSPKLATEKHLTWHTIGDVLAFAHTLTQDIALEDDYRDGDCTMVLQKCE